MFQTQKTCYGKFLALMFSSWSLITFLMVLVKKWIYESQLDWFYLFYSNFPYQRRLFQDYFKIVLCGWQNDYENKKENAFYTT